MYFFYVYLYMLFDYVCICKCKCKRIYIYIFLYTYACRCSDAVFKGIVKAMNQNHRHRESFSRFSWPGGTTPGRFAHRPGCWLQMPKKQAFVHSMFCWMKNHSVLLVCSYQLPSPHAVFPTCSSQWIISFHSAGQRRDELETGAAL